MKHEIIVEKDQPSVSATISRRKILKMVTLGGAGLVLAPGAVFSACNPKKKRLGVALVGLGYYSTDLLAPALQQTKNCYLAGIVTGTPSKAEVWKKKYNIPDKNIYSYSNFDTIANNDAIDVVYVVLPPSMHHEFVIRAANAGKHVWCEKPMALTETECREMIDVCKKNKRSLAIGYRLQHEPHTQEWIKIVREKLLGPVKALSCEAGYYDDRTNHWKQKKEMGGGALYDMGVYSIQGARLGTAMEPVAVVSAQTSTNRPDVYKNGLDETTTATLEFPGGLLATIKTSLGENINSLDIVCDKGTISMSPYQSYAGLKGKSPLCVIHHSYSVPWQQAKQMDDDAEAIMNDTYMIVPGEEGSKDIRIVEAIYKAAASGLAVNL